MKPRKIMTVFGTRPEAVKMAPVIQALEAHPDFTLCTVLTAQHRELLDEVVRIFEIPVHHDLDLMRPDQSLGSFAGRALPALEALMRSERPDAVLVQGDTSTVFLAALAAYYEKIPVGHVEAGLRTGNMLSPFPEEGNRRLAGVLTSFHFAPTVRSAENLMAEGVDGNAIYVTGNPVVDALEAMRPRWRGASFPELEAWKAEERGIVTVTAHRRESFGEPMERICRAVARLATEHPEIVFAWPVHPNPNVGATVARHVGQFPNVATLPPLDYLRFLRLLESSLLVLSDSGGVQEEGPSLGVPVLVMRERTERPEALEAGTAWLVGTGEEAIYGSARRLLQEPRMRMAMVGVKNPFGDGHAGRHIVEALLHGLDGR